MACSLQNTQKHVAYHDLQIQHLSKDDSRPFWSEVKRLFDYKKMLTVTCNQETRN